MRRRNGAATVTLEGAVIPAQLPVRVTRRLDTAEAWLKELAAIYRDARRGRLLTDDASRLAYIAGVAAKLAKDVQELRQNDALRAAVEAVEAVAESQPALSAPIGNGTDLIATTDAMVAASITALTSEEQEP